MEREDVMVMVVCAVLGVVFVAMAVMGWLPGAA
jgi:hypothetical protein